MLVSTRLLVLAALLLSAGSLSADDITLQPAPKGFDKPRENIPHGKLEAVKYESKATGGTRTMVVYTPPGYSKDQKYPVLYLLHGAGDDQTGWTTKGAAHTILDNLYAEKKIEPMIVVMPNGFAQAAGSTDRRGAFRDDLLQNIIPYIDSHYPTLAERDARALAGLSMGAGQSLTIGLANTDKFAWIGAFSGGGLRSAESFLADPESPKKLNLLWLSSGDSDRVKTSLAGLHSALDEKKIPHTFHIEAGGHEWPVWNNDVYWISQQLFREKK